MNKKNRGFTLIELLAVIVITGVLAVMIVPRISNLVLETRLKIYLQDAKKMISQAQYKINSNNIDIEKPEMGECIVFSLNYLASNELKKGPNDGDYLTQSSFVVVKNEDGVYEYAVVLIESRSDGLLQGVEFVTEDMLSASDASRHVRYFDSSDIRYIDTGSEDDDSPRKRYLDTDYINEQLTRSGVGTIKWVEDDSIARSYNEVGEDASSIIDASSPKFSAKVVSKDSGGTGLLEATLTINASDVDDPLNSLMVCTRISTEDDNKFPSVTNTPELCESYGELNFYSKDINFSDYGLDYETNTVGYVYITVTDPSGHSVKKLREYTVHKNDGPEIKAYDIHKLPSHDANMPTARVEVSLVDDINATKELEVCFDQDYESSNGVCTGLYHEYDYYFHGGNTYDYTFLDIYGSPIEKPDGSTHSLTMYVRDKEGKVSRRTKTYDIYKNKTPTMNIELVQEPYSPNGTYTGRFTLSYSLLIDVHDDLSDDEHIFLQIGNDEMTYAEYKRDYLNNPELDYFFKASGEMDGKNRTVVVKVWDQYQDSSMSYAENVTLSNIYVNEQPKVKSFRIIGNEKICIPGTEIQHCLVNNSTEGAYNVKFDLRIKDDNLSTEDIKSKILVCISETKEDCVYNNQNLNLGRFSTYNEFKNRTYSFQQKTPRYEDSKDVRYMYLNIVEVGNIGTNDIDYQLAQPYVYSIYANRAPEFISGQFTVDPASIENEDKVIIDARKVKVFDDFDDYTYSLCYRMVMDTSDTTTKYRCYGGMPKEQLEKEFNGEKVYTLLGNDGYTITAFKGQLIEMFFRATDYNGLTGDSKHYVYELMNEDRPRISSVDIKSLENFDGSNKFGVSFRVADQGDTYKVCFKYVDGINTKCTESDYIGDPDNNDKPFSGSKLPDGNLNRYSLTFNGENDFGWPKDYNIGEPDNHREFIFSVIDSQGLIANYTGELTYDSYHACQTDEFINENYEDVIKPGDKDITTTNCEGRCYHDLSNVDSGYQKMKSNLITSKYTRFITGFDQFANEVSCSRTEDVKKSCDDSKCMFAPKVDDDKITYIGLERYDTEGGTWDYVTGRIEQKNEYVEHEACTNIKAKEEDNSFQYFSSFDSRCSHRGTYCLERAKAICSNDFDSKDESVQYNHCLTEYSNTCQNIFEDICNRSPAETLEFVSNNIKDLSEDDLDRSVVKYCNIDSDEYKILNSCRNNVPFCETRDMDIEWFLHNQVRIPIYASDLENEDPGNGGGTTGDIGDEGGNTTDDNGSTSDSGAGDDSSSSSSTDGDEEIPLDNDTDDGKGLTVIKPKIVDYSKYYIRNQSCTYAERNNPECNEVNCDNDLFGCGADPLATEFHTTAADSSPCTTLQITNGTCTYSNDNGGNSSTSEFDSITSAVGTWHMKEIIEIPTYMYNNRYFIDWSNDYNIQDTFLDFSSFGIDSEASEGEMFYSLSSNSWFDPGCRTIHIEGGRDATNKTLINWLIANSEEGSSGSSSESETESQFDSVETAIGTWHLNAKLNIPESIHGTYLVTWNTDYDYSDVLLTFNSDGLTSSSLEDGNMFYYTSSNTWLVESYRTIHIIGGDDIYNNKLIQWLLANSEEGAHLNDPEEPISHDGEEPVGYRINCPDSYKDTEGNCPPVCDSAATEDQIMNKECILESAERYANYVGKCFNGKVYLKRDCSEITVEEPEQLLCTGRYYAYKRVKTKDNVLLLRRDESQIYCPEELIKHPDEYKYDPTNGKRFILFNPKNISNYDDISIENEEEEKK